MEKPISYTLLLVFQAILLFAATSVMADPRAQTINYTCSTQLEHNGTIYVQNFVSSMENISEQIQTQSYGIAVNGTGPDASYGFTQCYGDLSSVDCVLCFAEARTIFPQCYPYNGGRIFLDGCFMRSENYSFFQEYKSPLDRAVCGNKTRQGLEFRTAAKDAVLRTVDAATVSKDMYARAKVKVPKTSEGSVYVLANCWTTLNTNTCRSCLQSASASMLRCLPMSEARALNTGCFMRYSDTNFLNKESSNGLSRATIIIVVLSVISVGVVLAVGITIGVYIWKYRYVQKKRRGSDDARKLAKTLNDSSLNFKYSVIEKATDKFDEANKLGQGGFGTVYKGVLPDGREIAVKRLFFNNRHRAADFYNEVNIISSVDHRNLVRLLGCSCSGPESLLVYEYLHNKSLDQFIFDANKGKVLDWEKRFEIIIGTAEGLVYLHETSNTKIIHRDIKASNILLDSRLRAKIADFGLAREFQEDKSHVSTAIAGTLGYMAPEYIAHGQLSEKADVYSFGVLLLEIVTGKQNNRSKTLEYSDSLITNVWRHFLSETMEELYDPNLKLHEYHNRHIKDEAWRVVHIGLLCTQESALLRPAMSTALQMLTKKDEPLPDPTNPPFIDERTMGLETSEDPSYPLNANNSASLAVLSHSSFYPR
jgi:hypothetical protein